MFHTYALSPCCVFLRKREQHKQSSCALDVSTLTGRETINKQINNLILDNAQWYKENESQVRGWELTGGWGLVG